jgi:hypothetical protein
MSYKSLASVLAVLMALAAGPAVALDLGVSVGASASTSGNAGNGDSSLNVDLGVDAALSAAVDDGDDGDDTTTGSVSANAAASATASVSASSTDEDDPLFDVIGLINASAWTSTSFSSLNQVNASVNDVSAWINSENSAALNAALEANAGEITDLQTAIAANAAFSAVLDAEGEDASNVIAVGVTADGSLAVFTE